MARWALLPARGGCKPFCCCELMFSQYFLLAVVNDIAYLSYPSVGLSYLRHQSHSLSILTAYACSPLTYKCSFLYSR